MANVEAKVMQHLRHLCVDIGPRPSGSKAIQEAADYIEAIFRDARLDVERQEFECASWELDKTVLEVDGHQLEARANWFSPSCDVLAPAVAVGSLDELQAAELSGKILIVYGDLTSRLYLPERHDRIVQCVEEKRPAVFIMVDHNPCFLSHLIRDRDLSIPSATVLVTAGLTLLRRRDQNVRIRIDSRSGEGHACNVLGKRRGKAQERIVVCAHYDTVFDSPGAMDNGSGVAVLLTLAEILAGKEMPVGLEFVAFGDEESGSQGDVEYLRRYGLEAVPYGADPRKSRELGDILTVINTDGVGQQVGTNTVATFESSEQFNGLISEVKAKYPGIVSVGPWPGSNQGTFHRHGVPCIAMSSIGVVGVGDTRADTIKWTSSEKLCEVVSFIEDALVNLQDRTSYWSRRP